MAGGTSGGGPRYADSGPPAHTPVGRETRIATKDVTGDVTKDVIG